MTREGKLTADDWASGLVVLPLALVFCAPLIIWVAVRDAGYGRWVAAWWVSLAVALAGFVAVLEGLWWLPVVVSVEGLIALAHIAIRVWRDVRAEERSHF